MRGSRVRASALVQREDLRGYLANQLTNRLCEMISGEGRALQCFECQDSGHTVEYDPFIKSQLASRKL